MSTNAAPDIKVVLRHVDPPGEAREYALNKLGDTIYSVPGLQEALVEVTYEATAARETRYAIQVTLFATGGQVLRAEERGSNVGTATDAVHDVLTRRIRDWKGLVYYERRRQGTEQKEELWNEQAALPPQEQEGGILRKKSYEIKPMFSEDAIYQMEMLGHDFFFFLNAETEQYNVMYRRKAGGYGLIEPSFPPTETSNSR